MTLPEGSINPDNLPVGVFKHDQLATVLQDNTKAKFGDVGAGRFPTVVNGTNAGNPANVGGPLGFIVDLFAKLTEDVANADPATIQGPDDLHPLITNFFEGLPIIGIIVETINEISQLFTGEEDGDSDDLSSWVNSVLGRDVSLAGRVATIEGKIAVGAEFFDDFNRGDNDTTLGNGWVQGGAGQPLGIHDQAAQIKRVALPAEGVRYAICPTLMSGDDFTVSGVIHPAGVSDYPSTVLYARSDTALSVGICALFSKNTTRIARYTRSGTAFTYSPILTGDGTKWYSNSATVQFKGSGTTLQVVIDNVLVHTVTDTGHTIGNARRTVGFSAQCETAILAIPQYSGGLASFAMRSSVTLDAVALAKSTADTANTNAGNAISAASAAQGTANTANTNASTALTEVASKNKTSRQPSAPTGSVAGDIWIDTTNGAGKDLYNRYDGSTWVTTTEKVATEANAAVIVLGTGDILDEFTTSGTWIKRAGVKRVTVHMIGGGGAGGGGANGFIGIGGAIGGYSVREIDATTLSATVAVTVGAGAGAVAAGAAGGTGGTSAFGAESAGGGSGGRVYDIPSDGIESDVPPRDPPGFGTQTVFVVNVGGGYGGYVTIFPGGKGSPGAFASGGAGGALNVAGSPGTAAPAGKIGFGSSGGGGGGGQSGNTSGRAGGSGAAPGGGGGGGGSSYVGGTGGGGAAGGAGRVYVVNYFS